jgi:hypothetical protein
LLHLIFITVSYIILGFQSETLGDQNNTSYIIYGPNCLISLYLGIELKFMISVQEKYRLKKQKKYAPKVLIRRPVARRWPIFLSYYFQILWKLHISFFYDVCPENKICTLVWENINILFVFGAFSSVHGNWYQVHDLYTLSCLIKINS